MLVVPIKSAKLNVVFPAGQLPVICPEQPEFALDLGGVRIGVRINAKAARKLAQHAGGAALQGRLVTEGGKLALKEAGLSFFDVPPAVATVTLATPTETGR